MKLKLMFFVIVLIFFQDSSCMEIFTWLGYKSNRKTQLVKTEDNIKPEISENTYIKSSYDEIPNEQEILKSRIILKESGNIKANLRLKYLKEILDHNLSGINKENTDKNYIIAENIIIASYSTKKTNFFKIDYGNLLLLLSSKFSAAVFDPELIFKIITKMPTLYSVIQQYGFKENYEETSPTKQINFVLLYAKLLLNLQQAKLNSELNYQTKDALLKILIGKIGGSVDLLKLISKSIDQEAKYRSDKITKIETNLLETSNNFESAKDILSDSIHIWALINKRIKLLI